MPLVSCPHCGEDTFTISDWADLDHCATCGRPLGAQPIELGSAVTAKLRVQGRRPGRPPAPGSRAANPVEPERQVA